MEVQRAVSLAAYSAFDSSTRCHGLCGLKQSARQAFWSSVAIMPVSKAPCTCIAAGCMHELQSDSFGADKATASLWAFQRLGNPLTASLWAFQRLGNPLAMKPYCRIVPITTQQLTLRVPKDLLQMFRPLQYRTWSALHVGVLAGDRPSAHTAR